jgi:hypothetical protein
VAIFLGVDGFKFGCDPEMFLKDDKGVPQSAYGIIPGTKQEPFKVEGGTVQVDGMAAEIGTDPAESFDEWNGHIVAVLRQLKEMLPSGWGLGLEPSVRFSQEIMDAQPETAKELGCDPDYNAWTGEVNPYPDTLNNPCLRTFSGHLHIGWTEKNIVTDELHVGNCRDLVKQMDWFLGAWSVQKDPDKTRRQLYGKAGAFRPKPYGVEYRVLSNFWLKSKDSRRDVWNRTQAAIASMRENEMSKVHPNYSDEIVEIINASKRDAVFERAFAFPLMQI